MPAIIDLRADIQVYLRTHGLLRKWEKAKALFENDPTHPSLNTELLEPRHRLIYSFRLETFEFLPFPSLRGAERRSNLMV